MKDEHDTFYEHQEESFLQSFIGAVSVILIPILIAFIASILM